MKKYIRFDGSRSALKELRHEGMNTIAFNEARNSVELRPWRSRRPYCLTTIELAELIVSYVSKRDRA